MRADGPATIDLDALALQSGGGQTLPLQLDPEPPVMSTETLILPEPTAEARVDVSRTTAGYALRLRLEVEVEGTCSRCLGRARRLITVDAREVEQTSENDPELLSPYVEEGVLDVDSWVHDAITLALPERLLCRDDCSGLCEECGANLNEFEPGTHSHERPPDPRFAKLRELTQTSETTE